MLVVVLARRYYCDAVLCGRRVFTERFDADVLEPWARRTARLDHIVHHLGLALGGRPAASFARRLMVPVSKDTLLRLVRRRGSPRFVPPTVIGSTTGRGGATSAMARSSQRMVRMIYDAVADRHPDTEVIIPPRATAVPNEITTTQRDRHIAMIEKHGRMGWQRRSGYNRRSLVETAVYRYKTIIGRRLQARTRLTSGPRQRSDATCSIG